MPTHPQALQKSQPSLRMTVWLPHSLQRAPFITAPLYHFYVPLVRGAAA